MTPKESGQRGGTVTKNNHVSVCPLCGAPVKSQFFAETGKKGGEATLAKHGREFYVAIGKKGGRPRNGHPTTNETTPEAENRKKTGGITRLA